MVDLMCALDVHYDEARGIGQAAAVIFDDWQDALPRAIERRHHPGIEPYVSGAFFRRELPVLLPLVEQIRARHRLGLVIVDGHVDVADGEPGLGRHLYETLERAIAVVGVAKNEFRGAPARPVYRGRSGRPLWVSATFEPEAAAAGVLRMHGAHRVPTLLRLVDRYARTSGQP
jgi:deoxyribonuclease V